MAVPDTTTFSLQDVVNEINPTTDDLVNCISDAVEGNYDSRYYITPATSLLEFRNYGPSGPESCDSGMDVVFIFDYSLSMDDHIEAAKSGAVSIISTINSQSGSNDYRLGLVIADEYLSDTNSNYINNINYTSLPSSQRIINTGSIANRYQWLTTMEMMGVNNGATFTSQLDKLNGAIPIGNGILDPEPMDLALSKVVENNFAGSFRNGVTKYVIMVTDDEPGGDDDSFTDADIFEIQRLISVCNSQDIKVIVLGAGVNKSRLAPVPFLEGDYFPWRRLADDTGGSWNVSYDASTIQSEIINNCSTQNTGFTVAYVTSFISNSITSIDISDPNNLIELDTYTSSNLNGAQGIRLDLNNNLAYVVSSTSDSITSIDISNPNNLIELDSYTSSNLNGARNIALDLNNNVAYVTSLANGTNLGDASRITSIDISNPNNLVELDSYRSSNLDGAFSVELDLANNVAYVVSYVSSSITSINISDPNNLIEMDSYISPNLDGVRYIALDLINNVAYVASLDSDKLTSINISNPNNLIELDTYTSTNLDGALGIKLDLANNVAYVTSELSNSITSINISNPNNLTELDSYTSTNLGGAFGLELDLTNNLAYVVSTTSDSITSIDISNPNNLTELDSYTSTNLGYLIGIALG
jgi:6-phosphogluconolactonase (cycloisomerase 2 family)